MEPLAVTIAAQDGHLADAAAGEPPSVCDAICPSPVAAECKSAAASAPGPDDSSTAPCTSPAASSNCDSAADAGDPAAPGADCPPFCSPVTSPQCESVATADESVEEDEDLENLEEFVHERWTIFEEVEDEVSYLRKRSTALARALLQARAEIGHLHEAGLTLQEAYEQLQQDYREVVGDIAYWQALAEARAEELEGRGRRRSLSAGTALDKGAATPAAQRLTPAPVTACREGEPLGARLAGAPATGRRLTFDCESPSVATKAGLDSAGGPATPAADPEQKAREMRELLRAAAAEAAACLLSPSRPRAAGASPGPLARWTAQQHGGLAGRRWAAAGQPRRGLGLPTRRAQRPAADEVGSAAGSVANTPAKAAPATAQPPAAPAAATPLAERSLLGASPTKAPLPRLAQPRLSSRPRCSVGTHMQRSPTAKGRTSVGPSAPHAVPAALRSR